MPIVALGYMGIRSQALADWSDYAGRLLGMQKVDTGGGSMAFRMMTGARGWLSLTKGATSSPLWDGRWPTPPISMGWRRGLKEPV